jgi:hypothetical protein
VASKLWFKWYPDCDILSYTLGLEADYPELKYSVVKPAREPRPFEKIPVKTPVK